MQDDTVSEPGASNRSENAGPPDLGPAADPPTSPDETTGVRRRRPLIAEPAVPPPPDYSPE